MFAKAQTSNELKNVLPISNALWLNLIPLLNFLCWLAFSIKELRLDWILSGYTKHLLNIFMLLLSHNNITDASTDLLLQLVSINPSIHTVRLFGNKIVYRTFLEIDKFEIW
ncbi:4-hydroxy-tetrahydrodipicolinate synthase [Dissostichus eleginoides]|uniref:4-hydroxy-tetrahydrodipicolinate synthase n=1 Tax=Dissostichus eleginoides TaxID=100907 RepID=A0AAD9F6T9_DISEL|nr:4-hydroxy-tetrahydrodipicolinate synthase [Dissostichus eleginoides]